MQVKFPFGLQTSVSVYSGKVDRVSGLTLGTEPTEFRLYPDRLDGTGFTSLFPKVPF